MDALKNSYSVFEPFYVGGLSNFLFTIKTNQMMQYFF
jgi:hypothetical protein